MVTKQLKSGIAQEFDNEEAVIIPGSAEDITELMGDIDEELNNVTSEFGKDANDVVLKIKLHRVLERKGEREWLFDILPSELPIMDRVKDEYGGGKYQASLYANGSLKRKFNFSIANPRVNFIPKQNTNELASIVSMLNAQEEKRFNQLREIMQSNKPVQSFNTMEMITGVVALMAQVKNLLPQPAPAGNQIDTLLKGMELMRDFSGEKGESSLIDVFRDLIKSPIMEKALEGIATQVPTPATANQALLNPGTIALPKEGGDKMNPIIKGYLNQLVKKAAQNSDPELYAAFILDNVPEKMVREYLVREDLMQTIIAINPAAAEYAAWFDELKNNLTEMLTEDEPENLTQAGEPADTATDAGKPDTSQHVDEPTSGEGGN